MTYTYTGPVPVTPPATGATQTHWDNWWNYQRQIQAAAEAAQRQLYREALAANTEQTRRYADAIAADRESRDRQTEAMRANADAMEKAMKALIAALAAPAPAPAPARAPATRAELAALFLANMPELTSFTDNQMAEAAIKRADALLARLARV